MSEILVNTIKKADGTGGLTVPTGSGTVATLAGGTFTGDIAMGANNISFSNGNGIDFSASEGDDATSSILNDYEQGTWTPTYKTSGTNFSSVVYNIQLGYYTKIGQHVFFSGRLRTTSVNISGASGGVRIDGLPFVTKNEVGADSVVSLGYMDAFGVYPTVGNIERGGSEMILYKRSASNGAFFNLAYDDVGTGSNGNNLLFAGHYITDE